MNVNPFVNETLIQHRNLTSSQRRNLNSTKEGVVVNSTVKENENNLSGIKDSFLISEDAKLPEKLFDDNKIVDKKLLPLSAVALGVMGAIAGLTGFVRYSAKVSKNISKEKWLPAVTRNVNLSKEHYQVIFQMVQSPNVKTFIAGAGVLTLSAMAFMGKTFFDGYKDIWVKRKEANIQKNLQENLIDVETQAFSGKMQIIRSMLSKYSTDFEKYINPPEQKQEQEFGRKSFEQFAFKGEKAPQSAFSPKGRGNNSVGNILLGIGTVAGIVGLGFLSLKNLTKSKLHLQESLNKTKDLIRDVVKTSTEATKEKDKENLSHMFVEIENSTGVNDFVKEQINLLKWEKNEEKNEFLEKILQKFETSATKVNPNIGGDGTPKPAFNSFVDDYKAFFYNWLLDTSNPQFALLFAGITGITVVGYGGKLAGEALKEVQVKKINAETELNLQKRLVSTELRNFKAKKDSAISPLVKEFYKQVDNGRSNEELKNTAENILSEIKNGPPYVYS